jgi:cell wall-associated NlpC family hydrolase
MICIDDLLGTPFKIHGRNIKGYDCYGLAIEVLSRFGYKLVDLYEYTTREEYEQLIEKEALGVAYRENFKKVTKPEESDVLLFFNEKGCSYHIGVYLENNNFIHCDKYGVRISSLENYDYYWECYRWQK